MDVVVGDSRVSMCIETTSSRLSGCRAAVVASGRSRPDVQVMLAGLAELALWLAERQVEVVAMEATGVYWKPVYYALEGKFTVRLCNARNVKKVALV